MKKDITKGSDEIIKLRICKGDSGNVIQLQYYSLSLLYRLTSLRIHLYSLGGNELGKYGCSFDESGSGSLSGFGTLTVDDADEGLVTIVVSASDNLSWVSGPYLLRGKIGLEIPGYDSEVFLNVFKKDLLAGIVNEAI